MTADKNPIDDAVEQALDAFVYAPIGLLYDGPAEFAELVRNGRAQVENARIMGRFAVQMGRTEVQKRTADLDGPLLDLLRTLGVVPPAPAPAPTPTADTAHAAASAPEPNGAATRPAKKAAKKAAGAVTRARTDARSNETEAEQAAAERNAATDAATPSVEVLPIADYDSLSASQVVSRLRGLTPGQLEAIRAYESATRSRKTILNRVQQLTKS